MMASFSFKCTRSAAPEHAFNGLKATYEFNGTMDAESRKEAVEKITEMTWRLMAAIPGVYTLEISRGRWSRRDVFDTRTYDVKFVAWLQRLDEAARRHGHEGSVSEQTGAECWLQNFENGDDPEEAYLEDCFADS